jgi:hypothetical protein
MKSQRRNTRFRQHGIAAVEFALVVPFLVLLVVTSLYLGRIMWHYTAIQKAIQNGARFHASLPLVIMRDTARVTLASRLTEDIVRAHLDELHPGTIRPSVDVLCDGIRCNGQLTPTTIRVVVQTTMQDIFFPESEQMNIVITAEANAKYFGK